MKINFDDIITKANARKDALINLTNWVKEAGDLMARLDELHNIGASIKVAISLLDTEAQKLAGEENVKAMSALASALAYGSDDLDRHASWLKQPARKTINAILDGGK